MDPRIERAVLQTRRQALLSGTRGLGGIALGSMLAAEGGALAAKVASTRPLPSSSGGVLDQTHFPAKAKRVIYLFFSGGPSHIDMFRLSSRHAQVPRVKNCQIRFAMDNVLRE